MNTISVLGWLVLVLPLVGCIALSLWPGEPSKVYTRVLGLGFPAISFVLTAIIFATLLGRDAADVWAPHVHRVATVSAAVDEIAAACGTE